MSARFAKQVSSCLKFDANIYYWTDYLISYYWIRGDSSAFKPYVKNRVQEVQSLSDPIQWRHCPGKDNLTDLLSRGTSAVKLTQNELWWHGPPWLRLPPDLGPNRHRDILEFCSEELEHRSNDLLTFEELSEVEVIVNHRPLTYVENVPGEPEPLTQVHFLELGYGDSKYPIHFIELIDTTTAKESYKKTKTYRTLLLKQLWRRWKEQYLLQLETVNNFKTPSVHKNLKLNDVVLVEGNAKSKLLWEFGIIKEIFIGRDNNSWLDKHYSDFAPGKSTVEKWFAKFKRGEMSTEDDARSGHPKEAVTDENIKKVHKIIFDNRKVKLIEIAETLKISKERVGHIVNEYLDMRKLCSNDYCVALLERLKDEIAEKRHHLKEKKVLFHQDNAPCHKSMKSITKLHELGFKLLLHPPYNPDLAPSDIFCPQTSRGCSLDRNFVPMKR
ncbi:integrase catalytic domain-containing protein [Trichonephila clavipes]|nr:integrase catalytic domain-containing protein [Trichonephila clavipes]